LRAYANLLGAEVEQVQHALQSGNGARRLMSECLFPDNTVLCNFAALDRLDLLAAVLGGRARWTEDVAYETGKSAGGHPQPQQPPTGACPPWSPAWSKG
jgi:hypothetical protein